MAEINIEPKKRSGMAWMWVLLVLAAVALIAWWLWPDDDVRTVAGMAPLLLATRPRWLRRREDTANRPAA